MHKFCNLKHPRYRFSQTRTRKGTNQTAFLKMLQDGKVDFVTRSKANKIIEVLPQNSNVSIEKLIQTTGNGLEDAEKLITKTLF